MTTDARRYPLAALVAASGLTERDLSRVVAMSGSALKAARERGLSSDAADRYAVRAGLHPGEVWPSWTQDQIALEAARRRDMKAAAMRRWRAMNRAAVKAANQRYYTACEQAIRAQRRRKYAAQAEAERAARRARYARQRTANRPALDATVSA